MKRTLFLIMLCIVVLFPGIAQDPGSSPIERDTVYISSGDIRKLIDDKYYVRVPSTDLEMHLQERVSNVVNDKFNIIYGIIGIASLLIGSILVFNVRSYVNSQIDSKLSTRDAEFKSEFKKDFDKSFSGMEKHMDTEIENYFLRNFKVNMEAALASLREEQDKALQAQEEFALRSVEMMKVYNEVRYEKLKANVDGRKELQKTLDELSDLLQQAEKINDLEMLPKVLDELAYVSFLLKKDAEFKKLFDRYAERTDLDIKATTFVNTALGTLYDYQNTGDIDVRDKTLMYLNKALRKLDYYGEALGMKLELFMTDYEFNVDAAKKELALLEVKKLLEIINSKDYAASETIRRLKRIQASSAKSKYIDMIFEKFPEEMQQMENLSNEYAAKSSLSK